MRPITLHHGSGHHHPQLNLNAVTNPQHSDEEIEHPVTQLLVLPCINHHVLGTRIGLMNNTVPIEVLVKGATHPR